MYNFKATGVIFLSYLTTLWAVKYTVMPTNEVTVFTPCPGEESNFISKYVSMDHIKFERINDETINIVGYYEWVQAVSDKYPISLSVEVFKYKSGQWIPTVFTIRRENFCKVLFLPTEMWYVYSKDLKEKRCPPPVGTRVPSNSTSNMVLDLPKNNEGTFKAVFRLKSPEADCCFKIDFELYKT